MITVLLIVLVTCLTFLITDFRRHQQIQFLHAHYKAEMDRIAEWSYEKGMRTGSQFENDYPGIINPKL